MYNDSSSSGALPRVCVIGAGSSGITAVKALHERGIPFDCFERSDTAGGMWVYDNKNGVSSAYDDLCINTSKPMMQYSDFPIPDDVPDFPHHTHLARYFNSYVDHFGLRDEITFETSVERAYRRDDGLWEISLDSGETRLYDVLLVANGHHWNPRGPQPAVPGTETFPGEQIHSHHYRKKEMFAGKRVAVVGMGNSALDIVVESSYVAAATTLVAREGAWIVPKYMFGKPYDQYPEHPQLPMRVRFMIRGTLLKWYMGNTERLGLPQPRHKFNATHGTVSNRIFDRLAHGAITPKPAIERIDGSALHFADGSSAEADVIVWCTGYRITFPFFDEDFISAPENRIELFRRAFDPDIPNLAFICLLQPLGATMPLAEAQGKWIGDYLRGRYALPSRQQMVADIRKDQEQMRSRYVKSPRHTIQVDVADYFYQLERERRAGEKRARRGGYALPIPPRAGALEPV